jgi:hypothetical protein
MIIDSDLHLCTIKMPTCGRFISDKSNNYRALEMCEGVTEITVYNCKRYQIEFVCL